jgi:hypothetical protein
MGFDLMANICHEPLTHPLHEPPSCSLYSLPCVCAQCNPGGSGRARPSGPIRVLACQGQRLAATSAVPQAALRDSGER